MARYFFHGSTYKPTQDTTFFAIWSQDTIKINFDANTGEGNMDTMNILPGSTNTKLSKNKFEKTDYVFEGWNTKVDGTGTKYEDEAVLSFVTEDITLYAIWKEEIIANVIVTDNKFTEGTKITLGGQAKAKGIQKIELKIGNNILYGENVEENTTIYNKLNLGLDGLKQEALLNLDFYDITLQLAVTSTTGQVGTTNINIKNYTIGNNDSLRQFAQVVNGGNSLSGESIIQLTNLSTYENDQPIGLWKINTDEGQPFSGTYDGKGYKIEVKNRWSNTDYSCGLFGYIAHATIKDLTVYGENAKVNSYYGGICGVMWDSTIQDCCNNIKISSTSGYVVGGIVGWVRGTNTVDRCYNSATIIGWGCVGGVVGWMSESGSRVNSCYNKGNIETYGKNEYNQSLTGGIVGCVSDLRKDNSELTNCYNTGSVKGNYGCVGGLIGTCNTSNGGRLIVRNCYDVGSVSSSELFGSIHGMATHIDYYNTYSIFEDPNSDWTGCNWDSLTKGGVAVDVLKGMAGTLGSAYKADTGINGGYPILTWQ